MRESIGGAWLFQIAIIFILLFTGYLALSVNYSRAFKVKNEIISIIERSEGLTPVAEGLIKTYLSRVNHTIIGSCPSIADNEVVVGLLGDEGYGKRGIYCVKKTCVSGGTMDRNYYQITVFFKFDLPVLGDLATFRVSGETKTIYNKQDWDSPQLNCKNSNQQLGDW